MRYETQPTNHPTWSFEKVTSNYVAMVAWGITWPIVNRFHNLFFWKKLNSWKSLSLSLSVALSLSLSLSIYIYMFFIGNNYIEYIILPLSSLLVSLCMFLLIFSNLIILYTAYFPDLCVNSCFRLFFFLSTYTLFTFFLISIYSLYFFISFYLFIYSFFVIAFFSTYSLLWSDVVVLATD